MRFLLFIMLCVSCHAADIYWVAPTGSMKPLFDENYFLYVESRPFREIKEGDIIIYKTKWPFQFQGLTYDLIVHKVWRRSSGGSLLLCWGVANPHPDPEYITESMYVGTVVKWITKEDYFK